MNVHLNRLHKLQKKSIRSITFSDYIAHSQLITDRLNVFNIYDLFKLQLRTIIYKYSLGLLPKSLYISFDLQLNVQTYNTRNCNKLNVNLCRTKHRQATVSYLGHLLWNSMDDSLKQSISISIFRKTIKLFFLSQCINHSSVLSFHMNLRKTYASAGSSSSFAHCTIIR